MRISKEPEERKQEILETAIKLFSVNGFEKTSISDIAKEIGIAQGLCYRYFPSKDVLFQSAINEYSNILVANMTKNINIKKDSLIDISVFKIIPSCPYIQKLAYISTSLTCISFV